MTERIQKQKEVANFFLNKLEMLDPNIICAGGAPRDWSLGKEASDIDIFMRFPNHSILEIIKTFARLEIRPTEEWLNKRREFENKNESEVKTVDILFPSQPNVFSGIKLEIEQSPYDKQKEIRFVYDTIFENEKVQIVVTKNKPEKYVMTWELSNSRVLYRKECINLQTQEYQFKIVSNQYKFWELMNEKILVDFNPTTSGKWKEKIKEKFSSWRQIDESQFKEIISMDLI